MPLRNGSPKTVNEDEERKLGELGSLRVRTIEHANLWIGKSSCWYFYDIVVGVFAKQAWIAL
jgi:hypothetical protein